jgi:predicted TIM-barrel fold metal-dependent hydrolase
MRSHVHDPYVVGVRLAFSRARSDVYRRLADGALDPLIALAVAAGIPVMITAAGRADVIGAVARTFPRGRFIVDHMGVHQSLDGTSSVDPLAGFDKVLGLASLDNVAVKITGAPTLSRAGYPFDDLRAPIRCLLDRFTPERVIWGSDYSRIRLSHTLDVALDWIRLADWLSDAEKEWMLGRALASVIALPG